MSKTKENFQELVDLGAKLSAEAARISKELDLVKEKLRVSVREGTTVTENGSVEFYGTDGNVARVTLVSDAPAVKKGADVNVARVVLSDGEFSMMFKEVVSTTSTDLFKAALEQLTPAKRKVIAKLVEFREQAPRVSFKTK